MIIVITAHAHTTASVHMCTDLTHNVPNMHTWTLVTLLVSQGAPD